METINRLREERAQLVARLNQIDNILLRYQEWDREAKRLLAIDDGASTVGKREPTEAVAPSGVTPAVAAVADAPSVPAPKRVRTPMREFEAAVLDVLRESDFPMDRVALYDALVGRGIVIGDGDRDKELNALSARVYRMAKDGGIVSQRGEGYRLKREEENSQEGVAEDAAGNNRDLDVNFV